MEELNINEQDETELLKQNLKLTTARLEAVKMEAMEKLEKSNEMQNHLLNLLNIALQERDEAKYQLQKLQSMHVLLPSTTPSTVPSIHSHGSSTMTPTAYGSHGSIPKWTNPPPLLTNLKLPPPPPPNFFKHLDGAEDDDNHPIPDVNVADMVRDPLPYRGAVLDCSASNRQQSSGVARAPMITMVPNPSTIPGHIPACESASRTYQVSADPICIVIPNTVNYSRAFAPEETNQLTSLSDSILAIPDYPPESSSSSSHKNMLNPPDDGSNPNAVQNALMSFCFQDMFYGAFSKDHAENGASGSSSSSSSLKNILSLNEYVGDASRKLRRKHKKSQ